MSVPCIWFLYLCSISVASTEQVSAYAHALLTGYSGDNNKYLSNTLQEKTISSVQNPKTDEAFFLQHHPHESNSDSNKNVHVNNNGNIFLHRGTRHSNHKRYLDSISGDLFKKKPAKGVKQSHIKFYSNNSGLAFDQQHGHLLKGHITNNVNRRFNRRERATDATKWYSNNRYTPSLEGIKTYNSELNNQRESNYDDNEEINPWQKSQRIAWPDLNENADLEEENTQNNLQFQTSEHPIWQLTTRFHQYPRKEQAIKFHKRYLDHIAGDTFKRDFPSNFIDNDEINYKKYVDYIASSIFKRKINFLTKKLHDFNYKNFNDQHSSNPTVQESKEVLYFPELEEELGKRNMKKRYYLDYIGGSLFKRNDEYHKRYLDTLASSLFKRDNQQGLNKRYLDQIGSTLFKRDSDSFESDINSGHYSGSFQDLFNNNHIDVEKYPPLKRYLDLVGGSVFKKYDPRNNDQNNEYIANNFNLNSKTEIPFGNTDSYNSQGVSNRGYRSLLISIAGKNSAEKRYLDSVGGSLIKRKRDLTRWERAFGGGIQRDLALLNANNRQLQKNMNRLQAENKQGRTIKNFHKKQSSGYKLLNTKKRYLDGAARSLIKKYHQEKRYLDQLGSSVFKKNDGEKRYLDQLGGSVFKKNDGEKRYLDQLGSSVFKKNDGEKRYLDQLGSSVFKKNDGEKRYLDQLGSSVFKKNDGEKRYLDQLGSSVFKKNDGEKRYLDQLGSSVFKKNDGEKRYLDQLGSSVFKKNDGEKRYLDQLGSSVFKKNDGEKRYLDQLGSSVFKKNDGEKRYLDQLGSSVFKKNDGEKRYLDQLGSSVFKKNDGEKRYLDQLGSSVFKKDNKENNIKID